MVLVGNEITVMSYVQREKDVYIYKKKELSELQINQRLKSLSLTKRLISYEKYIRAVPKNERITDLKNSWHPETPRLNKRSSVSQWNKEMQKWRKQIHAWGNLSEETFNYICSLPFKEKNIYLSNLKLPELSKKEIKQLKKKNEELSDVMLENLLVLPKKKDLHFSKREDRIDDNKCEINNDINTKNEYFENKNNSDNLVVNKPLVFLPKHFNGNVIDVKCIIINHDVFKDSLLRLKGEYKEYHKSLFGDFCRLYMDINDCSANENSSQVKSDIFHLKKGEIPSEKDKSNVINNYFKNQKKEASLYLNCSIKKYNNEKKKKRF